MQKMNNAADRSTFVRHPATPFPRSTEFDGGKSTPESSSTESSVALKELHAMNAADWERWSQDLGEATSPPEPDINSLVAANLTTSQLMPPPASRKDHHIIGTEGLEADAEVGGSWDERTKSDGQAKGAEIQALGSPFQEQMPQSHIRIIEPKSETLLERRNKKRKLELLQTGAKAEPTSYHLQPSPVSPERHFRDIVAERSGEQGKMYKVVWWDSWVHESKIVHHLDAVREMQEERYGRTWDIIPSK